MNQVRLRTVRNMETGKELTISSSKAKELNIEFAFDRFDPLAERRLLYAKPFGSPRDMSFFCDYDEIPEISKLHCHIRCHMNFVIPIL